MKHILLALLIFTPLSWASNQDDETHHSHDNHHHEAMIHTENLELDPERFKQFVANVENSQIAIVDVNGMVCDFCARGIEKTFKKDREVKKVDVDLSKGKVLIAYSRDKIISFDEIEKSILQNGQNAISMKILSN